MLAKSLNHSPSPGAYPRRHPYLVSEAIVDLSQQCQSDAILLGASRENLLSQVLKGNVPLEIAQQTDITIILLRQVEDESE